MGHRDLTLTKGIMQHIAYCKHSSFPVRIRAHFARVNYRTATEKKDVGGTIPRGMLREKAINVRRLAKACIEISSGHHERFVQLS